MLASTAARQFSDFVWIQTPVLISGLAPEVNWKAYPGEQRPHMLKRLILVIWQLAIWVHWVTMNVPEVIVGVYDMPKKKLLFELQEAQRD